MGGNRINRSRRVNQPLIVLALAGLLAATGAALAFDAAEIELTCPITGQKFQSWQVSSYTTAGGDDELRTIVSESLEEYEFHTAPGSYYSGMQEDFKEGADTPVLPELLRIRDALSKLDRAKLPPSDALFPLEKVALSELCYSQRTTGPEKAMRVYLAGAWLADDAGEDDMAGEYRRKALPQIVKVIAAGKANDPETWCACTARPP